MWDVLCSCQVLQLLVCDIIQGMQIQFVDGFEAGGKLLWHEDLWPAEY